MRNLFFSRLFKFSLAAFALWTGLVLSVANLTGCASGGFKLTTDLAGWVNSKQIILRVILGILTIPIFAVTLIIDFVIFNTMDFWDGKVSQGTYNYKQDGRMYAVHHKKDAAGLRESRIVISGKGLEKAQELVIREVAANSIEVLVDGVKKGQVSNINQVPLLSLYNGKGQITETKPFLQLENVAAVSR